MKRNLIIALSVVLMIVIIGVVVFTVVTAMRQQGNTEPTEAVESNVVQSTDAIETRYEEKFKVGIIQHSLGGASSDCYGGFMLELDERKVLGDLEIVYVVEDDNELCRTKIKELVDSGCDLLYTIGQFASDEAAKITNKVPIVFGAVNNPDEVGLVKTNEVPGGNVTGVSSYTPCFEQIDLIPILLPNAKNLAVIYSATDAEAVQQGIIASREAKNIGIKCTEYTVEEDKDALTKTLSAIKKAKSDVIYMPVDKFLSENIKEINQFAYENKIPVICGDEATLAQGAFATSEINFESIGRKAAGMVCDILFEKKDVASLPVMYKHDCTNIVNKEVRDKLGIEIPATALGEIEYWETPTESKTAATQPSETAAQETKAE